MLVVVVWCGGRSLTREAPCHDAHARAAGSVQALGTGACRGPCGEHVVDEEHVAARYVVRPQQVESPLHVVLPPLAANLVRLIMSVRTGRWHSEATPRAMSSLWL